jgi:hypothetical protein
MSLGIKKRFFLFLSLLFLLSVSGPAQVATDQEKKEWQRLYPKLNSKMARMEEILNYIDRFLEDESFTKSRLKKCIEFSFLAKKAAENIPDYITKPRSKQFSKALEETHSLGNKLYKALEKSDHKKTRELLLELEKIRRKSHAKWVY